MAPRRRTRFPQQALQVGQGGSPGGLQTLPSSSKRQRASFSSSAAAGESQEAGPEVELGCRMPIQEGPRDQHPGKGVGEAGGAEGESARDAAPGSLGRRQLWLG